MTRNITATVTNGPNYTKLIPAVFFNSFWPLFIAAMVLILVGIGLRDPWPADEPRFAFIAKEMVETGQWFFPARAQELYPDKPPIFMWAIAIFYWLTGSVRMAFLLPSALSGLLTIFLVYDITKRLWDKKTALFAGWLLLFSFQFLLQAKTAQIDAMVCAWMTVASYGLLRYCLVDGQYKWYVIAWFFMGVGVITKGVGFLPLFMLIPYAWYRFKTRGSAPVVTARLITWLLGPLIMLFAIALWLLPMMIIVANSDNVAYEIYRDNIMLKQTVTRYADSWQHFKPAWYYVTSVIPLFWLPAIFALPWLIKSWTADFRRLDPRIILPLVSVVLVIVFFSASPGKRGVYILPALPMLVLAIAPYYQVLLKKPVLQYAVYILALLVSAALTVFALLGLFDVSVVSKLATKIEIEPWYFFLIVGVSGLCLLLGILKSNRWLAWPLFMSVLWLTYGTYGYVLRNNVSTPLAIFERVDLVLAQVHEKEPEIALVDFSEQFILFSKYPMFHFGYNSPVEEQLAAAYQWLNDTHRYILIDDKVAQKGCFDMEQSLDLGSAHRRHWVLLPADSKRESCEDSVSNLPAYYYKSMD
jgi:4-amino-4-deoxy-L-arabinose transferase-like glycosyltransferase